ncbi:MAG: twin-arginine translocase subunit TatC [Polyangiales bacterium]
MNQLPRSSSPQPSEEDDLQMTFFEHLDELRTRLVRSLVPFIPAFILAWIYREELFSLLVVPLNEAWMSMGLGKPKLHFASPVDPMVVYLKQSAMVAFLAASPWVFYQAWGFISPGLYSQEKRFVIPFVLASTLCFTIGGLFGWYYIFPPTFETLMDFAGELPGGVVEIEPTLMMGEYISFIAQMLFVFGITFEVPVIIVFLSLANIVSAKQLMRFGRWWVVVASLLAAILTPTQDALSMLLLMGPLIGLYYVAAGLAFVIDGRRNKRAELEASA